MGWKSWDCFGTGMTKDEVKKNADYMAANLKGHGLAVHHRGHTVVGTESQIARLPSQCGSEYGRNSSLPIAWRLYLPEVWCQDVERRQPAGVPEEVEFETKPEIALGQIRQAVKEQVPMGVVLADAGYGNGTPFRQALTKLGLQYMVGIDSSTTVWEPGQHPLPAPPRKPGGGSAPKRLQRSADHQPVSAKQLAVSLPVSAWREIRWRPGSRQTLRSRFAAVRVRPAHRDDKRTEPHPEEWLLIEWPKKESEPTKYWLSTLPAQTSLKSLVKLAKHRWILERDYEELKQELGLGHYEGRGWRGFHHHATLCIAAYGFLVSERNRFPPPHAPAMLDFQPPRSLRTSGRAARRVRPERHNPNSIATLRTALARILLARLPHCPFCGSRSA
ncbi:MAG: family transposase [Bryobacterales bacterium]|nr:family transposase [Bryobacterales bacterium]